MFAVRGATTVENDFREDILSSTQELLEKILSSNNIDIDNIVSIIFTSTKDIKSCYPAEAARNIGIVFAGLMCMQEMDVTDSLEKCIRIIILVNGSRKQNEVKHIYLKNSRKLRLDILKDFK